MIAVAAITRFRLPPLAVATGALVAGACTPPAAAPSFGDLVTRCTYETRAPGSYTPSDTRTGPNGLPRVDPVGEGTFQGAVLVDACVERNGVDVAASLTQSQPTLGAGKLQLPTGYALQTGDAALWATLTPAQKQRALSFLEAGSTIQSSLIGDQ